MAQEPAAKPEVPHVGGPAVAARGAGRPRGRPPKRAGGGFNGGGGGSGSDIGAGGARSGGGAEEGPATGVLAEEGPRRSGRVSHPPDRYSPDR